jgi:uncharacterized protein (TIGR00730 family)
MGEIGHAASAAGATIHGVVPGYLRELEMNQQLPSQEVMLTTDLAARKTRMLELADCFVAMPGGVGTLDEILEVASLIALARVAKPLIVVNTDGYWECFIDMLRKMEEEGFCRKLPEYLFRVVDHPSEVFVELDAIQAAIASGKPAALGRHPRGGRE